MEVMRAAELRLAEGGDVLHLEVGQPSTPAPPKVIAEAHRVLDEDVLGYTTSGGLEPLRARIAQHYDEWYRIDVAADAVMVTLGATGAFVAVFMAAFDQGDRVVVPSPGYPCYSNALEILGVEVVDLPTTIETRFQPTVEQLEALGSVDGLILSSPSNPTGTMLEADDMRALTDWCKANDVWFISDEIYHGITFGQSAPTALEFDPDAIVINSFSKYFSMTGWRLGWVVMPEVLREPLTRINQNATISAPTLSQMAAVVAFDCEDVAESNIANYAINRQILLDGLQAAGIDKVAPADGAFYIWADVSHLTDDSQALGEQWLDELGIAVAPGLDFDRVNGHRFIRFSFAGTSSDCNEAMCRLKEWVS